MTMLRSPYRRIAGQAIFTLRCCPTGRTVVPDFLAKNSSGAVPVLERDDGSYLSDKKIGSVIRMRRVKLGLS
jgi:hypothetical protein